MTTTTKVKTTRREKKKREKNYYSLVVAEGCRRRVGPPRRVAEGADCVTDPPAQNQRAGERRQCGSQNFRVRDCRPAQRDIKPDGDRTRRLGPQQRLRDTGPRPRGDAREQARSRALRQRREQAERGVGPGDQQVDRGVVGALCCVSFFFGKGKKFSREKSFLSDAAKK